MLVFFMIERENLCVCVTYPYYNYVFLYLFSMFPLFFFLESICQLPNLQMRIILNVSDYPRRYPSSVPMSSPPTSICLPLLWRHQCHHCPIYQLRALADVRILAWASGRSRVLDLTTYSVIIAHTKQHISEYSHFSLKLRRDIIL